MPRHREPDARRHVHERQPTAYQLAAGQDELRVPLTWTDGSGRHRHQDLRVPPQQLRASVSSTRCTTIPPRRGRPPRTRASRASIRRSSARCSRSSPSRSAARPSMTRTARSISKLDIEETDHQSLSLAVTDGWLAGMQHHFVSAIVPIAGRTVHVQRCRRRAGSTCSAHVAQPVTVAPGGTGRHQGKPVRRSEAAEAAGDVCTRSSIRSPTTACSPSSRGRCSCCSRLRTPGEELGPVHHLRHLPAEAAVLSAGAVLRPVRWRACASSRRA